MLVLWNYVLAKKHLYINIVWLNGCLQNMDIYLHLISRDIGWSLKYFINHIIIYINFKNYFYMEICIINY